MATPSVRGPYAKTAERRRLVATAALELVRESSHVGVTMSQIAERAQLSERSLFYHFPTRDHVLAAALELSDELTGAEISERDEEARYDIDSIVDALAHTNASREWHVRLSMYLSARAQEPDHPAHEYFVAHNRAAIESFANMLRHRQHRGLAHPNLDPDAVARRLVAVWDGLQAQWLVSRDFDLADEIEAAFRQLSGQNVMEAKSAFEQALA